MSMARTTRTTGHHAVRRGPGRPAGRTTDDGVVANRDALLDAAERLIRTQGPTVTLDAIAAEAGVTKPILYREVGDKDALVHALAERLIARMTAEVTTLFTAASGPHARLRATVGGYLQLAARDQHLYLYVTAGGRRDDRVHEALLLADRTAVGFAASIAAYRTAQDTDTAVAETWAYGIIGALHFTTLWWLRGGAKNLDTVADQITALLWSGLGGRKT
jgi:AcrR family transcriptional regulator